MDKRYDLLLQQMIAYYAGDPKRIQHFLKVHSFAALLGRMEGLTTASQHILETAAIVHDIGIKASEAKYGSSAGKYQEIEGPSISREMLERLQYEEAVISRVCWLVGHHHTYENIVAADHQLLVEADFLVNAYEDQLSTRGIDSFARKVFRSVSGKSLLQQIYPRK